MEQTKERVGVVGGQLLLVWSLRGLVILRVPIFMLILGGVPELGGGLVVVGGVSFLGGILVPGGVLLGGFGA